MLVNLKNMSVSELEQFLLSGDQDQHKSISQLFKSEQAYKKQGEEFGSGLSQLMDLTAQASEQVVDQFRVQVSLGSTIQSISEITENGLTVTFENGDICDSTTGQKYTSQINFLCDLEDNEYKDWNQ